MGEVNSDDLQEILETCEELTQEEAREKIHTRDPDTFILRGLYFLFGGLSWQNPDVCFGPHKVYALPQDNRYVYKSLHSYYLLTENEYSAVQEYIQELQSEAPLFNSYYPMT